MTGSATDQTDVIATDEPRTDSPSPEPEPEPTGPTADEGGDGTGDLDDGVAPVDEDDPPAGLPWSRVAVLGAALAFLGFAFALFVTRDTPPATDSVDVGYVQDMISHHEQALEMAQQELVNGTDPETLSYAREILIFQSKEIGSMERLLAQWDASRGDPGRTAMRWMGMPTPVESMPGMATRDEMAALGSAEGADADVLFLELMARHHVGGIHMSEYAAGEASTGDARDLAAVLARNQAIEVNEYAQTADRQGLPVEIDRVEVPSAPGS